MEDRSSYYAGSIDSHAHISLLSRKELHAETVLADAAAGGMGRVLDVGTQPSDLAGRLEQYGSWELLAFTAGLHPTAVEPESAEHELTVLEQALEGPDRRQVVAVGELGLDFYWSTEHAGLQQDALRRQFELAIRHELPVVIHNRDSEQTMLEHLRAYRGRALEGVMHCFSQDADYCRSCLDLGLFISFGGNLTYRRSGEIREAARLVPLDRLLVETDSPYLSPQAVRGTANHPGHLGFTIEALARIHAVSAEEMAALTAENARRLFRLP